MSATTKDERQSGFDFAAPPPPARPLPTTGEELLAQAIACCGTCGGTSPAAGPECKTIWTDEHGLECFNCIGDRVTHCQDCNRRFHKDSEAHWRSDRQWITPEAGAICWSCKEWRDLNKPAKELSKDEATPEAIIAFGKLAWIDDCHRYRATHRLRAGFERNARPMDSSASDASKRKIRREAMITAETVERLWRITRHRPLAELAEELWPLVDAYDRALRAGTPTDPEGHRRVDDLLSEANGGSRTGICGPRHEFPGPARLWSMIRARARREGRMPMWGVPGKFRFECRGMRVVATTYDRYRATTYGSEGFHLDRDHHRPGDPSFSSTGYRSMSWAPLDGGSTPQEAAKHELEAYIDSTTKHYGLKGKLERWAPSHIEYALDRRAGHGMFKQSDPDDTRHEHWNRLADEGEAMLAENPQLDPYDLFPRFKRQQGLPLDEPEPEEEDFDDDELDEFEDEEDEDQ